MDYQIAGAIGCFLIYVMLRFIIFEILTPILRSIPATRTWLIDLNEKGWLRAETRSRDLYVKAMRGFAAILEWATGRGLLRGVTFAFVAGACLFLATLPLERINGGAAREYQAARATVASISELGGGLCVADHLFAEVERQTGKRLFTTPIDGNLRGAKNIVDAAETLSATISSDFTLVKELRYGRALINRVSQLPPEIRTDPALASRLAAETHGDLMKSSLANITPLVPANRAFTDDVQEYCSGEAPSNASSFSPRRPRSDYDGLMARLANRTLAAMDAKDTQEAFLFFQKRMAITELTYAFFVALGGGVIILVAWKLAIAIAKAQWGRGWIILNLVTTAAMVAVAVLVVAGLTKAVTTGAQTISPAVVLQAMVLAPNQALEEAYQRQADVVVGHSVDIVTQTCVDVRGIGGSDGLCATLQNLLAPWDPVSRRFDYSLFVKNGYDPATDPTGMLQAAMSNPLGVAVYGMVISPQAQQAKNSEPGFWRGFNENALYFVTIAPILMTLVLAVVLLFYLELRKTAVKRVRRIVRPSSKALKGE